MKIFGPIYDKALLWAGHHHAEKYLGALSFVESCVLPGPPPDVMLAPMALAKPKLAWRFALITTILSVMGGLLGYAIGSLAFDLIQPTLQASHYWTHFETATNWFNEWGIWVVLLAGFTPIPYKIFTIAAGVVSMSLIPFILMSLLGRGARFFIVSGLMVWGGKKMEHKVRQSIEYLGWAVIILAVIAYIILRS